jgi:hypothetical protein
VFGVVFSNRTMVVLLYKHSLLQFKSVSFFTKCTYAAVSDSNTMAYVNNLLTCFKLILNFCSILIVFHRFFTWIALDDVSLHFLLSAIAVEEGTKWAAWLYHQCYQSIQMTVGVMVIWLSASLLQNISMATGCLCQVVLNRKLLLKLEKWLEFSSCVKIEIV